MRQKTEKNEGNTVISQAKESPRIWRLRTVYFKIRRSKSYRTLTAETTV